MEVNDPVEAGLNGSEALSSQENVAPVQAVEAGAELKNVEAGLAGAVEAVAGASDESVGDGDSEGIDGAVAEAKAVPDYESLEDVAAAARELSERDAKDIERVEVSRLRNAFMTLQSRLNAEALAQFEADGGAGEDFTPAESQAEVDFKDALEVIKEKKARYIAEQNALLEANLKVKNDIIDAINALAEDTDNVNRTFGEYRELQDKFNAAGPVPPTDETSVWKRFAEARERYSDNLKINKELRDYDFKKNLEKKELIVAQAKDLAASKDVLGSFRALQELHVKWREIGPVAKELRDDIWGRFKEASAEINKRYQAFFEERKAKESENEAAKNALCERVEAIDMAAITGADGWKQATDVILGAQEEWRKIGFASKKMNNALFNRFRATCDTFFALKADFFKRLKEEYQSNMSRKVALCERAEALKDSTDWKAAGDELVALQKEWKTIGTVARRNSDAVWKRFQTACDAFFDRKKKETSSVRLTEHANLQAKRDLIKELDGITAETPKDEALALINDVRERWKSIGHVPFRDKEKVYRQLIAKLDAVRDAYGLYERRGSSRPQRGEGQRTGGDRNMSEADRLSRLLETKRAELRTYENNLGFLSAKSKSGNALVRDFERKIEVLKGNIAHIESQLKEATAEKSSESDTVAVSSSED